MLSARRTTQKFVDTQDLYEVKGHIHATSALKKTRGFVGLEILVLRHLPGEYDNVGNAAAPVL